MASLIENLIGNALSRPDEKRLAITRRPLPNRPRGLFELFSAMGTTATFDGLRRALEFGAADIRDITALVLNRWPTAAEIAEARAPFAAWPHMAGLLRSEEFRRHIVRRVCDAFPERRRLLCVQVPRTANRHILNALDGKHPLLPLDLSDRRYASPETLAPELGRILSRVNASNSLAVALPSLGAFIDTAPSRQRAHDPLGWEEPVAPFRAGDLLFCIVREPQSRALSQVNGMIATLRSDPEAAARSPLAREMGPLPPPDRIPAWRQFGRALLASVARNPVCHALADGTSAAALVAAQRAPLHLVPLNTYMVWARGAFDLVPPEPPPPTERVLAEDDLTAADRDTIAEATAEDRVIHDRLVARTRELSVPGMLGHSL